MSETDSNVKHPLLDVTLILALLTALIYTAGWFFAFYHFQNFHIGLLTLEIPKEYFFMYGFPR